MRLSVNSERPLKRFPSWLRRSVKTAGNCATGDILKENGINTVCKSARCPNIYDCFSRSKCTFLLLGDKCTRSCNFCSVKKGRGFLGNPSLKEVDGILDAVRTLGMRRVTLTSVTRDDLRDGGASFFAECVKALKATDPELIVEVLVPDFKGERVCVEKVIKAGPDVFSHNVETSPGLYGKVRPQSDYSVSLDVLRMAREIAPDYMSVKSGFMVGLGESHEDAREVMGDLRRVGCDSVAIGQYLKPDAECLDVERYVEPEEFKMFSRWAEEMGFRKYSCSPFTRSSYLE